MFAQEIDEIAHRHRLGHRDEIAAHQTAGGFLGVGQRRFDGGAVFRLHLGEDGLLVLLVEILEHRDGVVGVELFGDFGDDIGGQRLDQRLAHPVVELGDHLDAHQVADGAGEAQAFALVEQLEKVGDVGGVERLDKVVDALEIVLVQRILDAAHEVGLQVVVLVEALRVLGRILMGFRFGLGRRVLRIGGAIVQLFVEVRLRHPRRSTRQFRNCNRGKRYGEK